MGPLLFSTLMSSVWVAAWLHWAFKGEARHMLVLYVLPKKWRTDDLSDEEFMLQDRNEFQVYLAASYEGPHLLRQWLGCPGCMSAVLGLLGAIFSLISGVSVAAVPLLWPCASWLGLLLHRKVL